MAHEAFFENEVPAEHIIHGMFLEVLNLFMAAKMLQTQNVDAVIAIGCVGRQSKILILFFFEGVTQE
jgi:6,7-dimethyl-8-ribityllumazine synthase